MKKIALLFLTSFMSSISIGQIDDNLTKINWKIDKEKVIYGNTTLRIEGINDIGGMTNIGYETFEQVKAGIEKDAEKQMWTDEKKLKKIESYSTFMSGGLIHLYITRLTIAAANTEMFTIIVKDSTETEIFRKALKNNIPNVPSSGNDYWWNYTTIPITKNIQGNFFVYVIDRLGNDNSKFKFEIKK